jgi:hypothetical protein
MQAAQARTDGYRDRILPGLLKGEQGMQKLFQASAPGGDVLRVIDVRRKYLTARGNYIDALWRLCLARADLFTAVGLLDLTDYRSAPQLNEPASPSARPATVGVPAP